MLFKRGKSLSLYKKIRDFFWPSIGWKRSFSYIKHRAIRINASNYAVAAGLAFGASISFTPVLGFHIIQSFVLCFIFRANFLAAILGTIFGNPWTFPLLFFISYKVGWLLLSVTGVDVMIAQNEIDMSFKAIKSAPWDILKPMFVGGYVMALITFPVFYSGFYVMVKSARAARLKIIKKKK